jgi:hypothetical protein
MPKSRYDRNVDKGAAQQRNYGQGAQEARKEDNKPGTAEEPARSQRHSGNPKNPSGPARGDQEPPWRPKPRGDNG